jgi:hypothetical protein
MAMRRFTARVALAAVAAGLMLATSSAFAWAALDQTAPTLNVPVRASFVVGDIVEDYELDEFWFTTDVAQVIRWSATDNVGVCSYDLYNVPAGDEPGALLTYSQETQFVTWTDDYVDQQGGGSDNIDGYLVTARDCTGNATTRAMTTRDLQVIQENGMSTYGSPDITYIGTWSQTDCACFLAEHTRRTSADGARATFAWTFTPGDQLALVMAKGPGRGRAGIRIDGKWVATVDTFSSVNTNRVIVFERAMTPGFHTVAIVSQATPGRPRIDLDAVLLGTENPYNNPNVGGAAFDERAEEAYESIDHA